MIVPLFFGKSVPLDTTSSGHYCVPIKMEYDLSTVSEVLASNSHEYDPVKTFLKLHRQFGHPPQFKLIRLLKDAGVWDEKYREGLETVHSK